MFFFYLFVCYYVCRAVCLGNVIEYLKLFWRCSDWNNTRNCLFCRSIGWRVLRNHRWIQAERCAVSNMLYFPPLQVCLLVSFTLIYLFFTPPDRIAMFLLNYLLLCCNLFWTVILKCHKELFSRWHFYGWVWLNNAEVVFIKCSWKYRKCAPTVNRSWFAALRDRSACFYMTITDRLPLRCARIQFLPR